MSAISSFSGAPVDLQATTYRKSGLATWSLDDFLVPLSRACRFGGRSREVYTVLDHSLRMVAALAWAGERRKLIRAALFHDFAEAIVGDVVTPVGACFGAGYTEIHDRFGRFVRTRFGVSDEDHAEVLDTIDREILCVEAWEQLEHPSWAPYPSDELVSKYATPYPRRLDWNSPSEDADYWRVVNRFVQRFV